MYKCPDCGEVFSDPKIVKEFHGLPGPYHELFAYCPWCASDSIFWVDEDAEEEEEE